MKQLTTKRFAATTTINGAEGETVVKEKKYTFGNMPVRDYWQDRRVARCPFKGEDRRNPHGRRLSSAQKPIAEKRKKSQGLLLRRSHKLVQGILLSGDVLCLGLALLVPAYFMGIFEERAFSGTHYLADATIVFSGVGFFYLLWNWFQGNYSKRCAFSDELAGLLKSIFICIGLESTVCGFWGERSVLLGLLVSWSLMLFLVPVSRLSIKWWLYKKGAWTRPTVIIGAGDNAQRTAEAIQSDWMLGFNIVEFIDCSGHETGNIPIKDDRPVFKEISGHKIPVRSCHWDSKIFQSLGNPHIVVATDNVDFWNIVRILYEQDVPYSSLNISPPVAGIPMIGLGMSHVFKHDVLMMSVQNNLARFIPRMLKRMFDLVMASIILVLLTPLFVAVSIAVGVSGKQIIYGHWRVGRFGKPFRCYKFRSMVMNSSEVLQNLLDADPEAKAEWEKDFKLKNDPRITRIGQLIRRTSIDELPQLFNVIKGDMSLVGPRPVVEEEITRYKDMGNLYHMVRPGITGLWQISGRNDISYQERVNLDSWYSKNWSLWYDLVILSKTIFVVLNRSGAY